MEPEPTSFSPDDARFMRLALRLAARGLGNVEPNPMVGAVVVREGKIIGRGYHKKFGGPHAEVLALRQAGEQARGATLYVTLEPCCHFGKTPPCADAVLAAGIARVVCAMIDPFPKVAGGGAAKLRAAGVRVDVGLLEAEAKELNRVFLKRVATGRPWVIAKWAQSLDGCIATASGESKWISSEASRQQVQVLRGRMDAILVGIGTALADDPMLTPRPADPKEIKRIPTRIVLDTHARLPLTSKLVQTARETPVIVACVQEPASAERRQALADAGVTVLELPSENGRPAIGRLLETLGTRGMSNVLVEGGAEVLAALLRGGFCDEAHIFLAGKVIGGRNAKHAVGGDDIPLADAVPMRIVTHEILGGDVHIVARCR